MQRISFPPLEVLVSTRAFRCEGPLLLLTNQTCRIVLAAVLLTTVHLLPQFAFWIWLFHFYNFCSISARCHRIIGVTSPSFSFSPYFTGFSICPGVIVGSLSRYLSSYVIFGLEYANREEVGSDGLCPLLTFVCFDQNHVHIHISTFAAYITDNTLPVS